MKLHSKVFFLTLLVAGAPLFAQVQFNRCDGVVGVVETVGRRGFEIGNLNGLLNGAVLARFGEDPAVACSIEPALARIEIVPEKGGSIVLEGKCFDKPELAGWSRTASLTVISGTGRYRGAKGELKLAGTYYTASQEGKYEVSGRICRRQRVAGR